MIIYHGITFLLLSVLVLIVGMIKPKWILFWMDNPSRLIVTAVAMAMFMGGAVMFGKGTKEKKEELAKQQAAAAAINKPVNDTPAPEKAEKAKPATSAPSTAPAPAPDTATNELRPD